MYLAKILLINVKKVSKPIYIGNNSFPLFKTTHILMNLTLAIIIYATELKIRCLLCIIFSLNIYNKG